MTLPDVLPIDARPLDLLHETRWMDALMGEAAPPAVTMPSISARGGLRTSIAVRTGELRAAEELVSRRYAWRGYRPVSDDLPAGEQGLRVVLLARSAGQLLGTLTVRPDTPHGLFAERSYGVEVHALRKRGHRLGELVKLAIEEGADWRSALDALVQSAYLLTRVVHALTDVVIEVNPRHVRFYRRVFGFHIAGAERYCERVGAPSVLLRLDLESFGQQLQLAA